MQCGVSKCEFSRLANRFPLCFQLPVVQSIAPLNGPKAGGTRVTIRGSRLDVGSELRVLVNGSRQCTDLRWDTVVALSWWQEPAPWEG